MIGIISIEGDNPGNPASMPGLILPDNLAEASTWSFVARPVQASSNRPQAPQSGADVKERVLTIRKHLREALEYLKAQEKGLHEAIGAVEGIGQLVGRRDEGLYPRIAETQIQEEFEILRIQLEGIRQRSYFNKPLFGNGATPPLRVHTSLWDTPRYEEVSTADLESLSLRLIYWGRVAGEGVQAPIHTKTVEDALRHLLGSALKNQNEQARLRGVFETLAGAIRSESETGSSMTEAGNQDTPSEVLVLPDPDDGPSPAESEDFLSRLRTWFQTLVQGASKEKCTDNNFHHNQDAVS